MEANSRRTFLAIALYPVFRSELEARLDQLKKQIPSIQWIRPEQIHITLHFFGETKEAEIKRIKESMTAVASNFVPFSLALSGIGYFPDARRPRIIWTGVDGESPELNLLFNSAAAVLASAGFNGEERSFKPHATLARIRPDEGRHLKLPQLELPATLRRPIREVILYESILSPHGPEYKILHTFAFSS